MKHKRGRKGNLSREQMEYAVYLRENGLSIRAISEVFGVSRMCIWRCLDACS